MSTNFQTLNALEKICNSLSERTATLFLGAGINTGIRNMDGDSFPLGQGLSNLIAKDLLNAPELSLPLAETAEMARHRLGSGSLNSYLYDQFSAFQPGTAYLNLVQLPWDVIYTTNYDLLVENAAKLPTINPAGQICPITSYGNDLTGFSEKDILYYKLHGSIDVANTAEGRLILTREDYRYYDLHRKSLFKRLERDFSSRTFVFIGYSLTDANLLNILDDCQSELGFQTLPLSFAIRPNFDPIQETYWRDKYNIQFIASDAGTFLSDLCKTWVAQNCSVIPFEQRLSREYLQVDSSTRFRKVGESFYRILPNDCTGVSDPKSFFLGAEPSWADIRDKIPPERDMYWTLFDAMLPELIDPSLQVSTYLITGAAGTGKTTLIRSFVYYLAQNGLPVLSHIPGTPLDANVIRMLVDENDLKRIIVIIRHASEYIRTIEQFVDDVRSRSLPVTVVLEERKNQWIVANNTMRGKINPPEFELGILTLDEIENILDQLEHYACLGKLTGTSREYQLEHFTKLANKELLVALRELTSESSFADIIRDEFEKIPSSLAKKVYVYVAALSQIDLAIRYETIINLLKIRYDELAGEVFKPAYGVLISGEEIGNSRHNTGFRLMTRHPTIASIIFDTAAPDDDTKFEIINALLSQLDIGYIEDRRLVEEISRRKALVETFASFEKRRAIYERLETIMPENPYILQHRSMLERDLENPLSAITYARKALKMNKTNEAFLNTLGLALEFAARSEIDPMQRQRYLTEASHLFESGIRQERTVPYGYVGKFNILRQEIQRQPDSERKMILEADALALLEEAFEATHESSIIAQYLAKQKEELGASDNAIVVLQNALEKDPSNTRLRVLLVQFQSEKRSFQQALNIAEEGVKYDPTSWRLQRYIAKMKRLTGGPLASIVGHYEAAIRYHKGDVFLMVEFGAFLFMNSKKTEANTIFSQARDLPITSYEKQKTRERWKNEDGGNKIFDGRVQSINGAFAIGLAIPENFEIRFWRNRAYATDLKIGDLIKFTVVFNAHGPLAYIEAKRSPVVIPTSS